MLSSMGAYLRRICGEIVTNSNNHFLTTELVDTMGGHTTSWLGSLPVTIQHQPQLGLLQQTDEPVQACDAQIRPTRVWEEGRLGGTQKSPHPQKSTNAPWL